MAIDRLPLRAARRNTLAACLAAALASGIAGSAAAAHATRAGAGSSIGETRMPWLSPIAEWAPRKAGAMLPVAASRQPASTITVDNCSDADVGSLRWAFSVAQDGDLIDLSALSCVDSRITLTSGEIVATVPNLSVQGPGQDLLAIDGNDSGRVFRSNYGLAVSDLTIARGGNDTGLGGCVLVIGDLTLTRSKVTGCRAGNGSNAGAYGGGVSVGGNLLMQSSTISNSDAMATDRAYGGGAYVHGSTAYFDGSSIAGNQAAATAGDARGGGVFAKENVFAYGSSIRQNSANANGGVAYGGGIHARAYVTVAESSAVSDNTAHSDNAESVGGGVYSGYPSTATKFTLTQSTLSGNTASSDCAFCSIAGGGAGVVGRIYAFYSTINDNHVISSPISAAWAAGGGLATFVYGYAGLIVLGDSTVSANTVGAGDNGGLGYGGGIATTNSSPLVAFNSTIAFNQASHAAGGAAASANGAYASVFESTIVANNQALGVANDLAPANPVDSFPINGTGNLVMAAGMGTTFADEEPLHDDPQLLPLADNGGATATHALAATSPAIDAGNNAGNRLYDQRGGCPYVRVEGVAADIGAFETSDRLFADGFEINPGCP